MSICGPPVVTAGRVYRTRIICSPYCLLLALLHRLVSILATHTQPTSVSPIYPYPLPAWDVRHLLPSFLAFGGWICTYSAVPRFPTPTPIPIPVRPRRASLHRWATPHLPFRRSLLSICLLSLVGKIECESVSTSFPCLRRLSSFHPGSPLFAPSSLCTLGRIASHRIVWCRRSRIVIKHPSASPHPYPHTLAQCIIVVIVRHPHRTHFDRHSSHCTTAHIIVFSPPARPKFRVVCVLNAWMLSLSARSRRPFRIYAPPTSIHAPSPYPMRRVRAGVLGAGGSGGDDERKGADARSG
ncbi:hypothetical protein K466DRAFT_159999 [Polyporus arcularius HHB13444]|uniref:Uncharacterized protein n=1 Tax=Polyporus arcularius HHB13444 TaxID=1314778 RepID=A0A5C3PB85_9APHY|nr:hypothetical protein K466DRAFT_159999 [Polyporus arcularius HHB13444]